MDTGTMESDFLFSFRLDHSGQGTKIGASDVVNWSPNDGKIWAHFEVSNTAASNWLMNRSGLPEGAVDILLADETRPRTVPFDDAVVVVLRGVNTNPGDDPEDMVSVRLWVDANRVISTRRRRLLSVVDIANALEAGEGPGNPGELLVMLIERLADRIGDFVDSIESRLEGAEDEIAQGIDSKFRARLSSTRRQIAAVRRFLSPQRDALDRLNRHPLAFLDDHDVHALRQETDRITRHLEDLDLMRERTVVLQEELLSQLAQQQNTRMYVLSVVAAVFLPLTFVTGLLGMNVGGLPGVDSAGGFMASVVVMVLLGAALLAFFRWKKWL